MSEERGGRATSLEQYSCTLHCIIVSQAHSNPEIRLTPAQRLIDLDSVAGALHIEHQDLDCEDIGGKSILKFLIVAREIRRI